MRAWCGLQQGFGSCGSGFHGYLRNIDMEFGGFRGGFWLGCLTQGLKVEGGGWGQGALYFEYRRFNEDKIISLTGGGQGCWRSATFEYGWMVNVR